MTQRWKRGSRLPAALVPLGFACAIVAACGFDGTGQLDALPGAEGGATQDARALEGSATDAVVDGNEVLLDANADDGAVTCNAAIATDPLNCGRCGHSCLGAGCVGGRCQPVTLATVASPYELTVDATDVYWTDKGRGTAVPNVSRCAKSGGPVANVVTGSANADPSSLVVAAGRVVFTDGDGNTVLSCLLPGSGCSDKQSQTGESTPKGIAWNGTTVYWVNNASGNVRSGDSTVQMPAFFAMGEVGLSRIAADATHVFWTVTGGVHGKPIGSLMNLAFALAAADPVDLAIDGTHVFVAYANEIRSVTYAGSDNTVVATGTEIRRVAVDASGIYFSDRGAPSGRVLRCPLAGCVAPQLPEVLASGEAAPFSIALDADHVYWTTSTASSGAIRRVAK